MLLLRVVTAEVLLFDVNDVVVVGWVHVPSSLGDATVAQCCRCSVCVVTVVGDDGIVVSSGLIAVGAVVSAELFRLSLLLLFF